MRLLVFAIALLLTTTVAAAHATQVSYIDQGQVWVSTLDGTQKRAISGAAPVIEAGESRAWTEQAQSDDGWIIGVARRSGGTGAAAPTRLWNPSGAVAAQSTLGYHAAYASGSLAVPVQLDLAPGAQQMTYTYSDLQYGYPTSTLYQGTWITNTSNSSGEPFDVPGLLGSSLAGGRWVGVDEHAGSGDANVVVEAAGGQGPFSTSFTPWFHATGATAVDVAANGNAVGVIYQLTGGGRYALGLFGASGVGAALTGASCDMPAIGDVHALSLSQDGKWIAWTDDRGLLVAPLPPLGSGSPCPLPAAPVVISPTGSYPSLGATTLATPAPTTTPVPITTPPPTVPVTTPANTTPTTVSSKPSVTVVKTVKAAAFAKGLKVVVTVKGAGKVTATAKVGKTTLAKTSAKARRAGKVTLTLKSARRVVKRLKRYKGKRLTLTVRSPGGTVTVTRKLR